MSTCTDNRLRFPFDVQCYKVVAGVAESAGDDLSVAGLDGWAGKDLKDSSLAINVEFFNVDREGAMFDRAGSLEPGKRPNELNFDFVAIGLVNFKFDQPPRDRIGFWFILGYETCR